MSTQTPDKAKPEIDVDEGTVKGVSGLEALLILPYYHDINNAESIVFHPDGEWAFVVGNNTFNGEYDVLRAPWTPYLRGGNIGVIRFDEKFKYSTGKLVAATTSRNLKDLKIDGTYPDEITIDSSGQWLLATFKGDNSKVLAYRISDIIAEIKDKGEKLYLAGSRIKYFPDWLTTPPVPLQTGTNPMGIASGPEMPTDLILDTTYVLEGSDDELAGAAATIDRLQFNFSVTGKKAPAPFYIVVYKNTTDDIKSRTEIQRVFISDAKLLELGPHKYAMRLEQKLIADGSFYWVEIDDKNAIQEAREFNNTDKFQLNPIAVVTEFDANPDDEFFGRYIYDKDQESPALVKEFRIQLRRSAKEVVNDVEVYLGRKKINGLTLGNFTMSGPKKVNSALYTFELPINKIGNGVELKIVIKYNNEQPNKELVYTIQSFEPALITDPAVTYLYRPDDVRDIYQVERRDSILSFDTGIIPQNVFLLNGYRLLEVGLYASVSATLSLDPTKPLEDIVSGFGYELNLFQTSTDGVHVVRDSGLNLGFTAPLSLLIGQGSKISGFNIIEIMKNIDALILKTGGSTAKIWNELKNAGLKKGFDDLLSSTVPYDRKNLQDGADYGLEFTYKEFKILDDFTITEGEISIKLFVEGKYTVASISKTIFPPWPPSSYVKADGAITFKIITDVGMTLYSPNNGTKPVAAKGATFSITPLLEGVLSVEGGVGYGAGALKGSITADIAAKLSWDSRNLDNGMLGWDLTIPFNLTMKLEGSALWGVFNATLAQGPIMTADDIVDGPWKLWGEPTKTTGTPPSTSNPSVQIKTPDPGTAQLLLSTYPKEVLELASAAVGGPGDIIKILENQAASGSGLTGITPLGVRSTQEIPDINVKWIDALGNEVGEVTWDGEGWVANLEGVAPGKVFLEIEVGEGAEGLLLDIVYDPPKPVQPALVADMVINNSSLIVGDNLFLDLSIANWGDQGAGSSEAEIIWSADSVVDQNDARFKVIKVPAIAGNGTWQQEGLSIALPAEIIGSGYIGFVADRRHVIDEQDDYLEDNIVWIYVEVGLPADRYEDNGRKGSATNIGGLVGTVTMDNLSIHNSGDVDWFRFDLPEQGRSDDFISLSRGDQQLNMVFKVLDEQSQTILSYGGSDETGQIGSATLSLEGLSAGSYYAVVGSGGEVFDYQIVFVGKEREHANLVIDDISLGAEILPDTNHHTARVTIANYGSETAFAFDVQLELDVDGTLYALGDPVRVDVLQAGQTRTLNITMSVPDMPLARFVNVRATVDANSSVEETNEADNYRDADVFLTATPDAYEDVQKRSTDLGVLSGSNSVTGLNLHGPYDVDGFRFRMLADGTAGDNVNVTFDEASGRVNLYLTNHDGRIMEIQNSAPAPGIVQISLEGVSAGEYEIWAYNESTGIGQVPGYTLEINVPDLPGPDLVAGDITIDGPFVNGEAVEVTTETTNFGDTAGGAFKYRYYLSEDEIIDPAVDIMLGDADLVSNGLAAGASFTDTRTLSLPAGVYGVRYIGIVLDTEDAVAETANSDNTDAAVVIIEPPADAMEPNESSVTAAALTLIDGQAQVSDLTISSNSDKDWFSFNLSGTVGSQDYIKIEHNTDEPSLILDLFTSDGLRIAGIQSQEGVATLSLNGLNAGEYTVRVSGYADTGYSTGYTLTISTQV
ncbi:CARDB domain-containing protein [Thermodesulfobacteriota bacterium]